MRGTVGREIRRGRKAGKRPTTDPPSMSGKTNVQITTETRDRLIALGGMNDSYENVIKRLLDERVERQALYAIREAKKE